MSEVVKFYPANAAQNPDMVLEQAVGEFSDVFMIGFTHDGDLEARASTGLKQKDGLWLIEMFKFGMLDGAYAEDE